MLGELPRDAVALEWGYEDTHDFERPAASMARLGIPFMVCPGTSSWNSITGRTANAIANIKSAAAAGVKHGALGLLVRGLASAHETDRRSSPTGATTATCSRGSSHCLRW